MPLSPDKTPRIVFRIQIGAEGRIGRGKIELLGHIRETGSISAAGRAMDMSYRRAWMLVDEMNRLFHEPVVTSKRGGRQGGGAALTPFGEALLVRYAAMAEKMATAVADDLGWITANLATE